MASKAERKEKLVEEVISEMARLMDTPVPLEKTDRLNAIEGALRRLTAAELQSLGRALMFQEW